VVGGVWLLAWLYGTYLLSYLGEFGPLASSAGSSPALPGARTLPFPFGTLAAIVFAVAVFAWILRVGFTTPELRSLSSEEMASPADPSGRTRNWFDRDQSTVAAHFGTKCLKREFRSQLPVPSVSLPGSPAEPRPEGGPSVGLSSSLVFLISIAIQGIGYIASFFTAHRIGADAPGLTLLSVAQLYLLVASTLSGLGDLRVGSAYVFYVARGRPAGEITSTYLALRLGLIAVGSAIAFALAPFLPFLHGATCNGVQVLSSGQELALFGAFLVTPLLWSPGTVFGQLWVAKGNSVRGQYPLLVQSVTQTAGLVVVALSVTGSTPFVWVATGIVVAYLLGGVTSSLYSLPAVLRYSRTRPQAREATRLFTYSWPLLGGLILQYVQANATPFFVQGVSQTAVTIFLAVNGFRILLMGIPNAVSVPLFPHMTNLHVQGEYDQLRRRTWSALRYTGMVLMPATLAIIVYRSNLIDLLFGSNYVTGPSCSGAAGSVVAGGVGGALALGLLAASTIPTAFAVVIQTVLNSIGRQRLELYLQLLSVAVLLGVAFALLPPFKFFGNFGLAGAGWAVLASSVAGFGLNLYFLERLLAVRIRPKPILRILGSSVVSFLVVSRLNTVINPTHWYTLLAALLLGSAAYYLVLAATGELTRSDVYRIVGFLGLPSRVARPFARVCWAEDVPGGHELLGGHHEERSDQSLDATREPATGSKTMQKPRGLR
jgi:O-antigen/teichoic acid export membrane protein